MSEAAAPELRIRPFEPSEIPVVTGWLPDPAEAVRWGGPYVRWPVDAGQFEQMLADPARTCCTFTVDGTLAGHFQLYDDRRRRTARLGRVAIAPELRSRRLATPMVRLATDLAFSRDPALHRMELQVYAENQAARAAYLRAGFSVEGVLREDVPVETGRGMELWTTVLMGLLRAEWLAGGAFAAPA